jgi:hypothetical protein
VIHEREAEEERDGRRRLRVKHYFHYDSSKASLHVLVVSRNYISNVRLQSTRHMFQSLTASLNIAMHENQRAVATCSNGTGDQEAGNQAYKKGKSSTRGG